MSPVARLYLWLLRISRTWRFNWAHKPLCSHYKGDVLQFGTLYLCRSCCCVYFAIAVNLILIVLFPAFFKEYAHILLIGLVVFTLPLSHPAIYKTLYRPVRDILRCSLGSIIVLSFTALVHGHFLFTIVLIITSFFFWPFYYRKRSRRKIEICENCPEYSDGVICSGYTFQAEQIRRYEDEATEYLLNTGYVPKSLRSRK